MQWINVEDRLPPNDIYVLVCTRHIKSEMNFVSICKRFNSTWLDDHNEEKVDHNKYIITHWMPVPDEPSKCSKIVEEEDVVEKAWISMADFIKDVVKERMSKEDVAYEIWLAIQEGTKEFLCDMDDKFFEKLMSTAFAKNFEDIEINFKLRKD